MPQDFFFTGTSENAVGGRFRKPQVVIEPEKIVVSVEEAFARNVRPVFDTQYFEAILARDPQKIAEGLEAGNITGTFGDHHFAGLIGLPQLSPGTGRPVRFERKAEQSRGYYRGLEIPQLSFPDSMDVKIYEFPLISRMHYPPSLLVVHTVPKNKKGRMMDSTELSHPFHGSQDFLERYGAYNRIGSHTVPEEFALQNWTDVYLYTDDQFPGPNSFQRKAMDTFYYMMKTGQVQRSLESRGVELGFEAPTTGERYESEEECVDCGRLYTMFGKNTGDIAAGKTSMLYCRACGNERENGFRPFYSRPLSPREAEHFQHMAVLAADSID